MNSIAGRGEGGVGKSLYSFATTVQDKTRATARWGSKFCICRDS